MWCRRHRFNPWVRKIPWKREWQPIPVFLPGESHEQRSLMGYSPWGCRVGHDWVTNTYTHTPPNLSNFTCAIHYRSLLWNRNATINALGNRLMDFKSATMVMFFSCLYSCCHVSCSNKRWWPIILKWKCHLRTICKVQDFTMRWRIFRLSNAPYALVVRIWCIHHCLGDSIPG